MVLQIQRACRAFRRAAQRGCKWDGRNSGAAGIGIELKAELTNVYRSLVPD